MNTVVPVFPGFSGNRNDPSVREDERKWGVSRKWSGVAGVDRLAEFLALFADKGYRRFVLNRPAGAGIGMLSGACYDVMPEDKRESMERVIRPLVADRSLELIAYIGSRVLAPSTLEMPPRSQYALCEPLSDHRKFVEVCAPLYSLGFTGFAFDAVTHTSNTDLLRCVRMSKDCLEAGSARHPLDFTGEPIPAADKGSIQWHDIRRGRFVASLSYINSHLGAEWPIVLPPGSNLSVWLDAERTDAKRSDEEALSIAKKFLWARWGVWTSRESVLSALSDPEAMSDMKLADADAA